MTATYVLVLSLQEDPPACEWGVAEEMCDPNHTAIIPSFDVVFNKVPSWHTLFVAPTTTTRESLFFLADWSPFIEFSIIIDRSASFALYLPLETRSATLKNLSAISKVMQLLGNSRCSSRIDGHSSPFVLQIKRPSRQWKWRTVPVDMQESVCFCKHTEIEDLLFGLTKIPFANFSNFPTKQSTMSLGFTWSIRAPHSRARARTTRVFPVSGGP